MGRREHLGDLEALVLVGVVRLGAGANGTAVYEELEARSTRELSLPAIHVTLRRLEEKGLLHSESGGSSPRGGRPRRFYQLTPAGIEALRAYRDMWGQVWSGVELPDPEAAS